MTKNLAILTIVAATLGSVSSWADVTPTSATSTASTSSILSNIFADYWGNYTGPSLGNLGSPNIPKADGSMDSKTQNLDGAITVGYKLNDVLKASLGMGVKYMPVPFENQDVSRGMLYAKLSHGKLISDGPLNFSGSIRMYLPTTNGAHDAKIITAFRSDQSLSYDIPNTRWSIGTWSLVRYKIHGADSEHVEDTDFDAWLAPHAEYKVRSDLAATFWTDFTLEHAYNKSFALTNFATDPLDFAAGVSWDVTPKFNLNPYIQIRPAKPTMNSSLLGMTITAIFL